MNRRVVGDMLDVAGATMVEAESAERGLEILDEQDFEMVLVDLRMVLGGQALDDRSGRPPELLVEGLRSASFRYRALEEDGSAGPWQDRWEESERMPLLVELRLEDLDGRPWPPVRVLLPQAVLPLAAHCHGQD